MSVPRSARRLAVAVGLVLLTCAAYSGVRANGFVEVDDDVYVTENAWVQAGLSREGLNWALTTGHAGNWHPLTWLSHMADVELFGLDPGAHHLVNVGLHASTAVLLFLVLAGTTRTFWTSAFVAAVFALHPLRVESVAWAAERKDVLAGLFWMLTLLAYGAYARRPGTFRYALVFVALALGLLCKPMLVTLPFVLLLWDLWPLGRTARTPIRRLVLEKLPLLALCVASCVITYRVQSAGGAVDAAGLIGLEERAANALRALALYAGKTAWPAGLAVFHPHPSLVDPDAAGFGAGAYAALGGLVVALVVAWRSRHLAPWVTVGLLWTLGTLVPVIGLVQVGEQAWAERYAYLPTVGLVLAVAYSVRAMVVGRPLIALKLVTGLAGMVLLACLLATRAQVAVWRDGETLFRHALAVTERNAFAHSHLAFVLDGAGDSAGALAELEAALEIRPQWADGYGNLGVVLLHAGRLEAAESSLRRALELEPDHVRALSNLGIVLSRTERADEARRSFQRATERDPEYADAWRNLGTLHLARGETAGAVAAFESAARLVPFDAQVQAALGSAHAAEKHWAEAVAALRRAFELDQLDLRSANRAAWILATCPDPDVRDGRTALSLAQVCVEATQGRRAEYLETEAAAHAALGAFDRAQTVQRRAIDASPERRRPRARARLQRYSVGEALVED